MTAVQGPPTARRSRSSSSRGRRAQRDRLRPGARRPAPSARRTSSPPTIPQARELLRRPEDGQLDPRIWLLWLLAMVLPPLLSRNPFILTAGLIVVLFVRAAWRPASGAAAGWTGIVRLAVVIAIVSALFNVATAPYGDQILVHLPGWWPLGDVMTANALVYGVLTGLAIVVILLASTTAGVAIDWPTLLRLLPDRFMPLAVASSIAWSFVPQTVGMLRDVRDAQWARGIDPATGRTVLPLLLPLLSTSLDRATTLSEALEARGFGGADRTKATAAGRTIRGGVAAASIAALVAGAFLMVGGPSAVGLALMGIGIIAAMLAGRATSRRDEPSGRTRYRDVSLTRRDRAVGIVTLLSLVLTVVGFAVDRDQLRYDPYPDLTVPDTSLVAMLAIALALAPVAYAPIGAAAVPASRQAAELTGMEIFSGADASLEPGDVAPSPRRRVRSGRHTSRPWACLPPRVRSGHRRFDGYRPSVAA